MLLAAAGIAGMVVAAMATPLALPGWGGVVGVMLGIVAGAAARSPAGRFLARNPLR
jgi:hypothetical protein